MSMEKPRIEPWREGAALLTAWISEAQTLEESYGSEREQLLEALAISGPCDPIGGWMRERLAHVERELERVRVERRGWQDRLFKFVERAMLDGELSARQWWAEAGILVSK